MTYLQLQRQQLAETQRHNAAEETETARANRAKEQENFRSNLAKETETHRSNTTDEAERNRHNLKSEKTEQKKAIGTLMRGSESAVKALKSLADWGTSELGEAVGTVDEIKTILPIIREF